MMNELFDLAVLYVIFQLCSMIETSCRETVRTLEKVIKDQNEEMQILKGQID